MDRKTDEYGESKMTEAELLMDMGDLLIEVMKVKNITVAELSRRTGMTRPLIYRYRSGTTYPTARNLTRLLNGLNISFNEIVNGGIK